MTIDNQSKAAMESAKSLRDVSALQEARRATGDADTSAVPAEPRDGDAEVVPRARRRSFANADKRRILQAADRCTQPGEIGALMRREGVYSSSLSTWRRQRERQRQAQGPAGQGQPRHRYSKPELLAAAPNQVWSWDITKLKGPVKWTCFHLYVIWISWLSGITCGTGDHAVSS